MAEGRGEEREAPRLGKLLHEGFCVGPLISLFQEFSAFSACSSWSRRFKERRGGPDEEWWAAEEGLLSNSTKLPEREGGPRGLPQEFPSSGIFMSAFAELS